MTTFVPLATDGDGTTSVVAAGDWLLRGELHSLGTALVPFPTKTSLSFLHPSVATESVLKLVPGTYTKGRVVRLRLKCCVPVRECVACILSGDFFLFVIDSSADLLSVFRWRARPRISMPYTGAPDESLPDLM